MGHAEVEVRWSSGAVPPAPGNSSSALLTGSGSPPSGTGWRLSLDVAPVLEAGETDDVIGDVFMAAANAGLFVHTLEGKRVLFDVSPAEAQRRCKRIPLLPRRTYHMALVGFAEGDGLVEAAWSTGRVDARLGFLVLDITGGGFVGERRVKLGDGLFQRKAPGSSAAALAAAQAAEAAAAAAAVAAAGQAKHLAHPPPGTGGHGISVSTSSPLGEFDRLPPPPGFAPPLWEWVAADASLVSTFATTAATVSAASEAAAAAAALTPGAAAAAVAAATAASIAPDRWPNERGLNVLAIRLEDLKVVYDRTFDTYGFKRKSSAECAALRAASGCEGELGVEGPLRWRWRDHLLIVTSAGTGWEAAPDSDIGAATSALMGALGAPPSVAAAVSKAALIGPANKSGGRALAALGVCGRAPVVPTRHGGITPSGALPRATDHVPSEAATQHMPGVTGYACMSPTLKDAAIVRLALACDASGWFPTFVCHAPDGRWQPAWSAWGDEPWDLPAGVPAAERRRVERYLLLLDELAPMLASSGTPGGPGRASLAPLLACLASFGQRHMESRGWPLMHRHSRGGAGAASSSVARRSVSGVPASGEITEAELLTERGDELVVAFERLLERLLLCDARTSKVPPEAAATAAEAACEVVEAGVVEYLCVRLSAVVDIVNGVDSPQPKQGTAAAAAGLLTGGGVLRVRTSVAAEAQGQQAVPPPAGGSGARTQASRGAAISEGRRICHILCRVMTADNCALLAEGVRRGALPSLLAAASAWLPAAPYSPHVASTWAAPHPGDVEEVLYRAAALDVTTLTLSISPPPVSEAQRQAGDGDDVAAAAWAPLELGVIRTGLTVLRPRNRAGGPPASGFAGPVRVIDHVAPKKGQPITLMPTLPQGEPGGAGEETAAAAPRVESPSGQPPSGSSPPGSNSAAAARAAAQASAAQATLEGCVLLFRARDAASAVSLVVHAPRLAYLASCAGAAGCVFLSQRVRGLGAVRPLVANPNFDTPTPTPSVCAPSTPALEAVVEAASRVRATWTARVEVGGAAPWGSAADIAAAVGPKCVALAAGEVPPSLAGGEAATGVASPPAATSARGGRWDSPVSGAGATPHRAWQTTANPRSGEGDESPASPPHARWQSASSPRRGEQGRDSPRLSATFESPAPSPLPAATAGVAVPAYTVIRDGGADESGSEATPTGAGHHRRDGGGPGTPDAGALVHSSGYWTEQLGPSLGAGLDAVVAEQMALFTRAGTCWDGTASLSLFPADTTTAASALATALSQALTKSLALAEGGDVAAAAATAAAAAQAVFGATSAWTAGDTTARSAAGAASPFSLGGAMTPAARDGPGQGASRGPNEASPGGADGGTDAVDPVREAAARFLASLTAHPSDGEGVRTPVPGGDPGGGTLLLPTPIGGPMTTWSPAVGGVGGPPSDDPVRAAAARILNALGAPSRSLAPLPLGPRGGGVRPVRVLSLDGGGVRGLVEIGILRTILATAQAAWPHPLPDGSPPVHLCDLFDLVVGTSTGGIIAAGIANGLSLDDLERVYRETATVIFKAESYTNLLRNYGPGATSARAMEAVLRARLGPAADAPLTSVAWGPTRRQRGLPRPHLCLVSQLASRAPCATFLLRSYGYASAPQAGGGGASASLAGGGSPVWATSRLAGDSGLSLLDSLRATSAAPWYMEEVQVAKDLRTGDVYSPGTGPPPEGAITAQLRLIDGGIVCNNPADVAIHEARLLYGRERPLVLVSCGTGCGVAAEAPGAGGYLPTWLQTLVNAIGDVHQTDATVAHLLGSGDTYWRFNPVGDAFGVSLDDARDESLQALASAAQAYADSRAHDIAHVVSNLVPR